MTIPTPPVTTPPWHAAMPDLLCGLAVPVLLKIWWWWARIPPNPARESGLFCWRAVRDLYLPNRSWFYPSPRPNPIRQTRHGGMPFGGWGCVLYRADVSHGMRASPSTCVLTIDWQVRGLCRCLWNARGLCLCPCVITPRGFTSLPTQEAEWSSKSIEPYRCFPFSQILPRPRFHPPLGNTPPQEILISGRRAILGRGWLGRARRRWGTQESGGLPRLGGVKSWVFRVYSNKQTNKQTSSTNKQTNKQTKEVTERQDTHFDPKHHLYNRLRVILLWLMNRDKLLALTHKQRTGFSCIETLEIVT